MPASLCRCAIVGHPVAHSLSPALYRAVFARFDLPWTYQAVDVAPGGLAGFVAGLDASWRGLSVTAPHKPDALRLGAADADAALVGGANTVVFGADGAMAVANTDVSGVAAALAARGVGEVASAVVVGAGATARSVLAGLARLGLREVVVQARDAGRAAPVLALARTLGVAASVAPIGAHAPCDLVVGTLPARAGDGYVAELVDGAAAVFDVVYDPWPTALAQAGLARGVTVVDGLDLLAGQAVRQTRLICGHTLPFDELRGVAQAALRR